MPDRVPILEAAHVNKDFVIQDERGRKQQARVVQDASIALYPGMILGLVGESGSGKTTLARMMSFVFKPSGGRVLLDGQEVNTRRVSRSIRRRVQLMFQDPFGSLNRLQSLRYILGRPLQIHGYASSKSEIEAGVSALLETVGLSPANEYIDRRPDDLSGGQRQRVVIARALATNPEVILADEPVSMLDVSIRLEILSLLKTLRDQQNVALLYVTHDIASARYIADTIVVMYAGRLVEGGPAKAVIDHPRHPYTRLLVDSTPNPADAGQRRHARSQLPAVAFNDPPSLVDPPTGCRFHPRCPFATALCVERAPETTAAGTHWFACWHPLHST